MSLKLYEASQLATLERFVNEETGEINMAEFNKACSVFEQKAQAVAAYINNRQAEIDAYTSVIEKLQRKKQAAQNNSVWLKKYLAENMGQAGISQIIAEDGSFVVRFYAKRDACIELDDGAIFSSELCSDPEPPPPSKKLIREAIERGEPVKGAKLVYRDRVEIR